MKGGWRVLVDPHIYPVEVGLARQQALADELAGQSFKPSLVMWRCQPSLLVTRTETRLPHFEDASAELQATGWPIFIRKSGGRPCPVGPGTVQISMIEVASLSATMTAKYTALAELMQAALCFYRIASQTGSVAGAYCPGNYDLAVEGRKIAGMSQHWFRNCGGTHCIVTAASINIEEPPDIFAGVVNQFYTSAGSPLRCQAATLTNIRLSGAPHCLPGHDLAAAVMNQLGLCAEMLGVIAS